jgi:hypothetical protein
MQGGRVGLGAVWVDGFRLVGGVKGILVENFLRDRGIEWDAHYEVEGKRDA